MAELAPQSDFNVFTLSSRLGRKEKCDQEKFASTQANRGIINAAIFGLVCFLLLLQVGCQTSYKPVLPSQSGETPGILGTGDVLRVSFTGAPELNQTQRIGSDGTLSLPLVGQVYAAGKRVSDLQNELAGLYKSQLQNSEVIVSVESRAVPVVVSGAVQKPGKITFERPATVLEAIMEAGGFTPEADIKRVSLIRIVKGQHHSQVFDLRPVLRGTPTPAIYVSSGDVIFVPEKLLNF